MTPTNLGGVFLLNKYFRIIISIFLVLSIVFSSFTSSLVYATDSDNPDDIYDSDKWNSYDNSDITNVIVDQLMNRGIHKGDADFYENFIRYASEYIAYGLGQIGAIIGGDLYDLDDNKERLYEDLKNITDNGKITIDKTSRKIIVNKNFTNTALDFVKAKTKEPDNGGYELVKTVPLSKISTLYFDSLYDYRTVVNLINDNDGMIGLRTVYGNAFFYKVNTDAYYVKQSERELYNSDTRKKFSPFGLYKNTNNSSMSYMGYRLKSSSIPALNWDDKENYYNSTSGYDASYFYGLDVFNFYKSSSHESYNARPLAYVPYLVTKSGVSIPVFNSLDALVEYTIANNLYYTSSDYTGEGKEIIIPFDEIDKILNGYYNGMYDLLQQLIEQNGGNALTPEQLQKLVDEVKASFGMIQDSINAGFEQQDILIQKNSEIMQNIADALNAFFSQTKDVRSAFMKSFNDYATSQKERDEMLYKLLEDYLVNKGGGDGSGGEPGDYYINIKSVSNDGLDANQREFTIETNIPNPYWESCLAWYPLNGVSDIQYTNGGTCILTFFNYSKRYNVYCKYNDTGQDIRCTSNTASVTIGAPPDTETGDPESDGWGKFRENVYQFFTDIMDRLDEIFYDDNGRNYFKVLHEDIYLFGEQALLFYSDCRKGIQDIIDAIGNIRIKSPVRPPSGSGGLPDVVGDFLDFLTDTGDLATDKAGEKTEDLIGGLLDVFGSVVDVLTEKFPFSIPWDILAIITALAAEPEPPHFEIPLVIEHYGINETFVIDFTEYQFLSDISRTFLTVIWTMYLMGFTTRFTDTKRK